MRQLLLGSFQLLLFVLPWQLRRLFLNLVPGFRIASSARIGFALVFAERLDMAPGSSIGHMTLVSPIGLIKLADNATLGRGNKVIGAQKTHLYRAEPDRRSALILGRHAAITRDHYIDCSSTVTVGEFSIIAGWRSQILTHSPDFRQSCQVTGDVTIGAYTFVSTGCIMLKGAVLPPRSILAAGSVLTHAFDAEWKVYGGSPAKPVADLDPGMAFFRRPYGVMARIWEEDGKAFGNAPKPG